MERFLLAVTVNVTAMYRDPTFYRAFRAKVVPDLRRHPFLRIWHVGCSTGEEVYSMAILLREEGLYPKCRVYATDLNAEVLSRAVEHGEMKDAAAQMTQVSDETLAHILRESQAERARIQAEAARDLAPVR